MFQAVGELTCSRFGSTYLVPRSKRVSWVVWTGAALDSVGYDFLRTAASCN